MVVLCHLSAGVTGYTEKVTGTDIYCETSIRTHMTRLRGVREIRGDFHTE